MDWYRMTKDEALAALSTTPDGLSPEEAEKRLLEHGKNVLGGEDRIRIGKIILGQVASPLIYILLAAGAVTAVLGKVGDAVVIMAVVIINGTIGFIQEYRAERSVRSLRKLVNPKARAIRRGREVEVDGADIVPGDVVSLVSGVIVPADLYLLDAVELRIDESMLTGESLPAEKRIGPLREEGLTPGDQENMAFMGSIVVSGRARGAVVRTGRRTELGAIAREVAEAGVVRAPIQDKIERLTKTIAYVVLAASAALFALGVFVGESVEDMFMTAVAAAVATIPEGLPIVVTIAFAIGVRRMARHNAIIRKLPAVETLGSATIVCSDKTGTLTMNEMTVRAIHDGRKAYEVTGEGYEPVGEIRREGARVQAADDESLAWILRIGLLCNESEIVVEKGEPRLNGDPTEGALIASAMKSGLDPASEKAAWPQLAILPFESERGYMATLHEHDGRRFIFAKGAPDRLMDVCEGCAFEGGRNEDSLHALAARYAKEGLRVLVMASKEVGPEVDSIADADLSHGLAFLGMQGMIDPPRPEAAEAVAGCRKAGIRVVMITGDHAETASVIADRLGIDTGGGALTGRELQAMSDAELAGRVETVSVYARVAPEHKLRIVNRLKERGHVVAVTGDGVNDAPALKAAHIGVAMGRKGTDVAREAADMVLADDNFASIYHAVREGRVMFDNLRKVIFFLIPTGLAAIWSILATVLLGIPIPYTPAQLLWINLVTNSLQDVALALEPGEPDVLLRRPRPAKEPIMSRLLVERAVLVSLVISAGVVLNFFYFLSQGRSLEECRTVAMTTMVLFQFFQVWNSRSERKSVFALNPFSNPTLLLTLLLAVLAQIAVIHFGPLQAAFGTHALDVSEWAEILLVAASVVLVVEIDKRLRRSRSTR